MGIQTAGTDMRAAPLRDRDAGAGVAGRPLALVRAWLIGVAIMVFAMVIVGGATRLTDSGLSITEWKPIMGAIPPLTDAAWAEAFEKYRQIPEYKLVNKGMSLAEFQFIFWWEWGHRLLGRLIGVVFFVPFALFWAKGWLDAALARRSALLFVLGGLQGAIGWWMVASGLVDRVDVAPYRLATHLTLAAVIFVLTVLTATTLVERGGLVGLSSADGSSGRTAAFWLIVAALAQLFLGGLVAGNDAGLIYNTWPLMGGRIVPVEVWDLAPGWRNLFENHATVQLIHRFGGYGLFAFAGAHAVLAGRGAERRRAGLVFALVAMQAAIGIATLVLSVPLALALLHQAMAIVILAAASWHYGRIGRIVAG